ncbi:hypothetical protein [Haloferax sulfurifontis]|uniref:Uncharacterized protein n=1 Tax=Haloferax sulfurifontis ATCC BAA-897 TaxID=662480 RepID=M0IIJ5_9EURY|nr:hypothetical protein [Haloferax sulfurifontis]ELZ96601.1 hypothetical protein C441_04514 [Haloferax sulfurifontis ATCC BAA-897]
MSDDYVDLGLTTTDVREHYSRVRRVYDALASIDASEGFAEATGEDGYPTLGSNDAGGWYVKRDNDDLDSLEQGFDRIGHAATFANDFDTLAGRVDRCLYALTSYKDPTGLREVPCYYDRENSETVWDGRKPTPIEKDLRGVMAWGDIDLVDELKPKRGDLDGETQAVVEETIAAYVDEFETLYGFDDAVFALDSVGGLYIMGAPAATLPIAEAFHGDDDAIERIMQAFITRSNDWLSGAQERVEERVDGAAEVIDPDWVNNHNRKFKAPLSVHSKHDAVVTPIDTDDPSYDLTTFDAVDEDLIDAAAAWSADLTATEYTSCIKSLVEELWPDYSAEYDDWKAALKAWVEDEREEEQRAQAARERARENRPDPSELALTTDVRDIYDALDRLDAESVAERTIVHQWTDQASGKTDNSSSGKRAFIPIWGRNSNGSATYIDLEKGTFVDTGDGNKHGTAVEMALIAEENWTKGDIAKGSDWATGVDHLRGLGFSIPVWIPEAGSEKRDGEEAYETMPFWAVRQAAVALGVLPEDAFVRKQGDDGRSFKAFPGATTYNRALAALEDEGFDHGREYMTDDGERPPETDLWGDEELEAPDASDASDTTETADTAASNDSNAADDTEADTEAEDADGGELHETTNTTPPATPGSKPPGEKVVAGAAIDYSDGGYGYWKTTQDGDTYYEEVTNFELEARSFLRAERGNEILVQLTVWPRGPEPAYELTCSMDVFNDVRRFRDTVVLGRTTTFDGSQSDLNEVRKVVGLQEAPERDGTHHMGLHRDEFVTPNGVLRHDGWTDDPTHVYQERKIDVERAWSLSPDKHTEYDPAEVVDMLELVHKTRHHERLLPVLGWFYSAPLRPFIQDEEGQFNHMHIRGGTGAGKSSTVETLTQMFGMDGSGKKVDSTTFTLMAAMASSNAVPIWFDEYKPGDIADYRLDAFQNLLRLNTKWEYDTRGNADKSTEEYHLRAPIVITGEQAIQGSAEERRSIQVAFRDDVKGAGNQMNRAFAELAGLDWDESEDPDAKTHHFEGLDLSQHALAFYRFALSMPFDDLRETWRESREPA